MYIVALVNCSEVTRISSNQIVSSHQNTLCLVQENRRKELVQLMSLRLMWKRKFSYFICLEKLFCFYNVILCNHNFPFCSGSGLHLTEALQMQLDVQRRLHEQLEVQEWSLILSHFHYYIYLYMISVLS